MLPNPLSGPSKLLALLAIIGVIGYVGAVPLALKTGATQVAAMLVISMLAFGLFYTIEIRRAL